uniref:Uncharacterized protein n=1 Tax=Rhizophora mucronata TaxID=61149 RepID=A0A2P2NKM2_RHIMU
MPIKSMERFFPSLKGPQLSLNRVNN